MNKTKFYHEKFDSFCKNSRWTKVALARECGVSRQTVTLWANGKIIPNETSIRMLAGILKVKASDISDIEESIPISENSSDSYGGIWASLNMSSQERRERMEQLLNELYVYFKGYEYPLFLTNAFLGVQSIIYVKDATLKYVVANKAFLDNLSLGAGYEVKNKTDFDFFLKREAKRNQEEDLNVFTAGKEIVNSERFIFGTKKKKMGLVSKYPIMDDNKQVIGILGYVVARGSYI